MNLWLRKSCAGDIELNLTYAKDYLNFIVFIKRLSKCEYKIDVGKYIITSEQISLYY
ncbi:MAG: hypothetical protein ACTJLM_04525 [Ehrlichia sp.]